MFSIKKYVFPSHHLTTVLPGHIGPVNCMAISPRGDLLASGGYDGIKIWDLKTLKELDVPQQSPNERGQVSCVFWITRENEAFESLVYGNGIGYLVFLQYRATENRFETVHSCRIGRGGEILALTADTTWGDTTRIATCTRDKCVQVWAFDSSSRTLLPIHSKSYENKDIVPKTVAFDKNEDRDLYVFGLFDGGLYRYGGVTAKVLGKIQLGSPIGNAAVDMQRMICVVDNVGNGFDLYKMDSGLFVRTLPTKAPIRTYPRGVAFADNTQAVIGGSDHGQVYIFDRRSGKVLERLKHSRTGGVETLAVHDKNDGSVQIATATATCAQSEAAPIRLWRWTPNADKGEESKKAGKRSWIIWAMEFTMKLVMIFATCAYFLGVLEAQVGYKLLVRPTWVATTERPPMVNEDLRDIIREAILAEMRNGASSVKETDNAAEETKAGGQKTAAHKTERLDFGTSLPRILGSKDLVVREA